jgi:hypothetical protein
VKNVKNADLKLAESLTAVIFMGKLIFSVVPIVLIHTRRGLRVTRIIEPMVEKKTNITSDFAMSLDFRSSQTVIYFEDCKFTKNLLH